MNSPENRCKKQTIDNWKFDIRQRWPDRSTKKYKPTGKWANDITRYLTSNLSYMK